MDIKVGLSIFNSPWMIEPQIGLNLFDYWVEMRNVEGAWKDKYRATSEGESYFSIKQKLFSFSSTIVAAPNNEYDLREFKGFDGATIAVIAIEGVMMKNNFCGDLGTTAIANLVNLASRTASVQDIVILIDSPGGTTSGTENLANEIRNSPKRTTAIADGYACSAAYWIGCSADSFYASGRTSIVGSIGTMASWVDNTKAMEEKGYVLREYYATQSKEKNLSYREANKGDGKRLIQESLNPLNDEFVGWVASRRPAISDTVLQGKTIIASSAVELGLIDGIKSINQVFDDINKSQHSKKANSIMTPFKQALIVANAESFTVAEGGFLLTEEQLTSISNKLAEDAVAMRTLTSRVQQLEASEASANNAEATIAQLNAQLSAKSTELATAQAALATAQQELAEEKAKPGADFSNTKTGQDRSFNPEGKSFEDINAEFEAYAQKLL